MSWNQLAGEWKQMRGKVREQWGKLTDDDLEVIRGKKDQLIGRLQEVYGIARDRAEKQIVQFVERLRPATERPAHRVRKIKIVKRRRGVKPKAKAKAKKGRSGASGT